MCVKTDAVCAIGPEAVPEAVQFWLLGVCKFLRAHARVHVHLWVCARGCDTIEAEP